MSNNSGNLPGILLVLRLLKSHESFHTQSILLGFRLCHSCPARLSPSCISVLPSCLHCSCFFGFCLGLSPCGCSLASTVPSSDPSKSGSACVPHRSLIWKERILLPESPSRLNLVLQSHFSDHTQTNFCPRMTVLKPVEPLPVIARLSETSQNDQHAVVFHACNPSTGGRSRKITVNLWPTWFI